MRGDPPDRREIIADDRGACRRDGGIFSRFGGIASAQTDRRARIARQAIADDVEDLVILPFRLRGLPQCVRVGVVARGGGNIEELIAGGDCVLSRMIEEDDREEEEGGRE